MTLRVINNMLLALLPFGIALALSFSLSIPDVPRVHGTYIEVK